MSAAFSQDTGPGCDAFTVGRTVDSIRFVDLGTSAGDLRILQGTLSDADGNKVGPMYAVSSLLPEAQGDGQNLQFAILIDEFPNGTISSTSLTPVPAADDESRGANKPLDRAVTGGTGDFANVTGVITAVTRDDGQRELR